MQCADTDIVNTPLEPLRPTHVHPFFCKQNLLPFIQSRWQPRTYFFNHYNVLFLMNLHSPSKSNTILGFILICLSFTTSHFHTRVLCKECSLYYIPFLILGSVSATVSSFVGIKLRRNSTNSDVNDLRLGREHLSVRHGEGSYS